MKMNSGPSKITPHRDDLPAQAADEKSAVETPPENGEAVSEISDETPADEAPAVKS